MASRPENQEAARQQERERIGVIAQEQERQKDAIALANKQALEAKRAAEQLARETKVNPVHASALPKEPFAANDPRNPNFMDNMRANQESTIREQIGDLSQPTRAYPVYPSATIINVTTHAPARTPSAADNSREDWASEFSAFNPDGSVRYVMLEELHGVMVLKAGGTGVAVLLPWPSIRHVVYAPPAHVDPPSAVPEGDA